MSYLRFPYSKVSYVKPGFSFVKFIRIACFVLLSLFAFNQNLLAQKTVNFGSASSSGNFSWVAPAGVTTISTLELWGAGGAGGSSTSKGSGGGGGGAYKRVTSLTVIGGNSYALTIGAGGTAAANSSGTTGGASSFTIGATTYTANGGTGGVAGSGGTNTGGAGGAAGTGNAANFAGGNGYDGTSNNGGGGGSSAGSAANGNPTTTGTASITGGAAVTNGGAGGNGANGTTAGTAGGFPGGGGGGSLKNNGSDPALNGQPGGNGKVSITFTCPTYSLTATSASNICANTAATVNLTGNAANLPIGTYTVTYNLSGTNTATGATTTFSVTTAGSGSFTTSSLANTGSTTITITNLSSGGTDGCSSPVSANNSVVITVNSTNTVTAASTTPAVCINTAITTITHTTTGATGIGTATGLPTGVTASWASNTISISGTPTVTGTFSYSIPLTGGCGTVNATGTITVNALPSAPTAGNQTKTYTGVANTTAISATAGAGETIDWYNVASGGTALATSSTNYTPVAVNTGTYTYYAAARNTTTGCISATRTAVTLTINKATLTVTADSKTKTYDGSVFSAFTSTITGFVNSETTAVVSGSVTYSGTATSAVNAGSYVITPVVSGLTANNYTFVTVNGALTISKATPTLSVSNSPVTYSGSAQSASVSGSVAGTVTNIKYNGSSTVPTNAGTYAVTADFTATDVTNYNSLTAASAGNFIINKATPVVTLTTGTYTYNGSAQGPSAASNTGTGTTYTYSYAGTGGTSYGPSATAPTNAGSYTVTASVAASADGNYNAASSVSTAFTISKATPTLSVSNSPVTYSGSAQSASISGSVAGTVTNIKYNGSSTVPTNASTYAVTADFTATDATNYNSLTAASAGNFIINTKSLTVTANNQVKCEGSNFSFAGTEFTSSGLVSGDAVSAVVLTSTGSTSSAAAGSFTISASAATGTGLSNYTITYINGTLTVNPKPTINLGYIDDVSKAATSFTIPYTSVTGSPDQFSLTAGATALSGFSAITNGSLTTSPLVITIPAGNTGVYNFNLSVRNSVTGCVSNNYAFDLHVTGLYHGVIGTDQTICAGTTPAPLTNATSATGTGTLSYTWEKSTTSVNDGFEVIPGATGATYAPGVLTITTYFKRVVSNGLETADTDPVTITVNALPVAPSAGSQSKTYTGVANLTAISATAAAGETVDWYTVSTGGTAFLTTSANYTPVAVNAGTYTYYAAARNTTTGCVSATRTAVTLTINKAILTVTAEDKSKTYDGAAFTSFTSTITGFVNSETATVITGNITYGGTALNVVNAGAYSINPIITGLTASNYSFSAVDGSLLITKVALTVTGLTGNNKTYDGNTTATASGTAALSGVVGSDVVTLSGTAAYSFATATVGTNKTISTTGYTLSGSDAGNYSLTQPTLTADITAKSLTITGLTGNNKVYDGNTAATASGTAALSGVVGSDVVTLSGTAAYSFATATVGTNKSITTTGYTLSGAAAGNYSLTQPTLTADITAKSLTITGLTGNNKVYDGNTTATASGTAALSGVVGSDVVTLSGTAAYSFATATVGTNKTISTTGYTLSGSDAGNYSLTQPTLTADITAKSLTITGLTGNNKVYDGNTAATASGTAALSGVVGSDVVTLSGTAAYSFATATVGTNKTISTTGYTLSGSDAGNYSLTQPTLTADITAKSLTITGLTGNNKVYDGNTTATASGTAALSGVVGSDVVTLSGTAAYSFATATVGTNKTISTTGYTLSGSDAGNYSLTQPTLTADITAKSLTITGLTGNNKVYDGNTAATASGTAALSGVVGSDVVTLSGTAAYSFATATVGTNKSITTTGYTLSGAAAGNYSLTQPTLTANITKRSVTVGLTGTVSKTFDGNTVATLTTANYTISDIVSGETLTITNTIGVYDNANPGTGKTVTVTSLILSGTTASNYIITNAVSVSGAVGTIVSNTLNGDYRSKASGLFNSITTWEYNDGSGWVNAFAVPGSSNNVTIKSAHTVTQNIDFTVGSGKTFLMENASAFVVAANKTLTVEGNADFNGQSLTFKSDITGTASFGTVTGTVTGATNVTVERYIRNVGRKWRLVNTPLKGSSNNSIWYNWQNNGVSSATNGVELFGPSTLTNGYVPYTGSGLFNIYKLKSDGSNWESVLSTKTAGTLFDANGPTSYLMFITSPYKAGTGNITTGSSATTLKATGGLIVGNYTSTPLVNGQFQLMPNPYAAAIDFNSITKNNIANTFWVWDPALSGLGGYVAFLNGVNSVTGGTYNGVNQTQIQSGQSFFVQAIADGATLTIKETDKVNSNGFVPLGTVGTGTTELIRAKLYKPSLSSTTPLDGTASVFSENGSVAVTATDDATDLTNWGEDIAIMRNNQQLAIEQRPLLTAKDTIFFRLSNLQAGTYQLEVEPSGFDWTSKTEAFLIDKFLSTRTPVSISTISKVDFTVTTNTTSTGDRFMLVFQPITAPLPVSFTVVKANAEGTDNKIEWSIGVESGIDRYEIEVSGDGRNFTNLAVIAAKNKDNSFYSWLHLRPQGEVQYYRIKAIEQSGVIKYSGVVSVRRGSMVQRIVITPNPVTGNILNMQFQNMPAGKYNVRMLNVQGLLLAAYDISHQSGNSAHIVPLPAMPAGIYEVKIENNNGYSERQRIIVTH